MLKVKVPIYFSGTQKWTLLKQTVLDGQGM